MDGILAHLRASIGLDATSIGIGAIERAVRLRIGEAKLPGIDAYRKLLVKSREEQIALIDCLVVPETWFFRDPGAFAAVAAEAQTSRHPAQLRFLCIPCATGEEPYSLAITLLESGLAPDRFHIDAFDISERLVLRARRGVYGRNSFRGNDAAYRARYFQETGEGCAINTSVRKQVTFRHANLLDDSGSLANAHEYDAVFCRNLLIYFDVEAQGKALKRIAGLLRKGGLLCVAPAETGLLLRHGFAPADIPHAFAFRNGSERKSQPPRHNPAPAPIRPAPALLKLPPPPKPQPAPAPLPAIADARRLADEGRFEEVSRICQAHIDADGASADAYYLLALVSDASARHEEAAMLYRKAIYLDPQHREALAHFSLLAEKLGQTAIAGALRLRALRSEINVA